MALLKKKELKREESVDSKKPRVDTAAAGTADERKLQEPELHAAAKNRGADMEDGGEKSKQDSPAPASQSPFARLRSRKVFFFSGLAALVLVAAASGLLAFKFNAVKQLMSRSSTSLEPVTSISRPVPIPDYREMLDFLVLNEVDNQKTLTSFRIEVFFNSPTRYQNYKDWNVVFRDTVYAFLQQQNTSRNTPRSWQTVVEKDLLEYIKVTLPLSRADVIKLTQVENL